MMNQIEALIDRLADIPLPAECPYMFEGIRTPQELRAYGDRLRQLSRENFGLAGPRFVRRLAKAIEADRALMQAFVDERQRGYWDAADSIKPLRDRDLTRITDKFATIYIAGCLAARFKILPFTETELLEALLTCERDHVAFIDRELGVVPARAISAHGAPPAITEQPAITGVVMPATTPYWIAGDRFEQVAGGSREAAALKKELFRRGFLETGKRGNGVSYVVKRPLPDDSRPFFVVIRHNARKSQGLGQALAAAAMA
jgi:hypothetical protein